MSAALFGNWILEFPWGFELGFWDFGVRRVGALGGRANSQIVTRCLEFSRNLSVLFRHYQLIINILCIGAARGLWFAKELLG